MILYHGAHPGRRDAILRGGLIPAARTDPGYVNPCGVFLATTVAEARYFGPDVWAVNTDGLALHVDPDSYNENGEDDNYYVTDAIEPSRVRLTGET